MTSPVTELLEVAELDARIRGETASALSSERIIAQRYPKELEEYITLRSGRRVLVRPIRPEDEAAHVAFAARLAPEDVRFRFFAQMRELRRTDVVRFTHIDYEREMAFIATELDEHGRPETLGVVRVVPDPKSGRRELAIVVRSDLKRQGLGVVLLEKMIRYCRTNGVQDIFAQVLADNKAMLGLAHRLGFERGAFANQGVVEIRLKLDTTSKARPS